MKHITIDVQPIQKMSEWRAEFGHCGRSFPSTEMYMSVSVKRVVMSGSICCVSNHFVNVSTDAVHLPRLPSCVHWYLCCIISGTRPQHKQRLVDSCPHCCTIFMLNMVLLIHFTMKCYPMIVKMVRGQFASSLPYELVYDQPIIGGAAT